MNYSVDRLRNILLEELKDYHGEPILLPYDKDFYQDYGIFVKPIDYPLSSRKIESLLEIAKMQKFRL